MLPNFIIGGASRSGTTSLFHYLRQHDDVFMPSKKELRFFDRGENYTRGLAYYEQCFREWSGEKAAGEASPPYFYRGITFDRNRGYSWSDQDDCPLRIHYALPDVKLIFSLRNPCVRAYSQYCKNVRQGREHTRRFKKALTEELAGEREPATSPLCWIYKNRYPLHLRHWLDLFTEDQMLFLIFEEWTSKPRQTVEEVCIFLGIDPTGVPVRGQDRRNIGTSPRSSVLDWICQRWLENTVLGRVIARYNLRQGYPEMDAETVDLIYRVFADDIDSTEDLLGRDLTVWREFG